MAYGHGIEEKGPLRAPTNRIDVIAELSMNKAAGSDSVLVHSS